MAGEAGRLLTPSSTRDSTIVRLLAFAALGVFAAIEWIGLVADPPVGRAALTVGATLAGTGALAWLSRAPIARPLAWTLGALAAVGAAGAGAAAIGVPIHLLAPGGWGELGDRLTGGLSAVGEADYPYGGGDEWARLTILVGLPLWLGLAGALAFWPTRSSTPSVRVAALVVVVGAYVTAASANPPGPSVWQGLVLLALMAGWLWLPRLESREALRAGAVVLGAGVIALPLAARLDGEHPWLDYRSWDWSSSSNGDTFSWDHSYGPLDWPRDGKTLLQVESDAPHYWRTAMLDQFDGVHWVRSDDFSLGALELPRRAVGNGSTIDVSKLDREWIHQIGFTVHSLRSDLVVGAGTVLATEGLYGPQPTTGGLALPGNDRLVDGDTYAIQAYVPDPTAEQMVRSPPRYSRDLARFTTIELPGGDSFAVQLRGGSRPSSAPPHAGVHDRATIARVLGDSPYGRMYGLAHRVTDGKRTTYQAVHAIQEHLQRRYTYSESPPQHDYPLAAFLFEDRSGYCQQFSGAMALMLRMVGIPSRVAAGFSAGQPAGRKSEYAVRDLDAHSWVEVYFNGIGWVTFDPTPAIAPAESQASGLGLLRFPTAVLGDQASRKVRGGPKPGRVEQAPAPQPSDGVPPWAFPAALTLALAVFASAIAVRAFRYRSLPPPAAADARLRELEMAVVRLRSWPLTGTTLLSLEHRLASTACPAAAGYAAKLRQARYGGRDPGQPNGRERRAMRRELSRGLGLRTRLRAFLAVPPGGPSPTPGAG